MSLDLVMKLLTPKKEYTTKHCTFSQCTNICISSVIFTIKRF